MVYRSMKEPSLCDTLKVVRQRVSAVKVGESAPAGDCMPEFGLPLSIIEGKGTNKLVLYFSKNSSSDRIKAGISVEWKMRDERKTG